MPLCSYSFKAHKEKFESRETPRILLDTLSIQKATRYHIKLLREILYLDMFFFYDTIFPYDISRECCSINYVFKLLFYHLDKLFYMCDTTRTYFND